MAFTLTEKAASEIKRVMEEQKIESGVRLRVGVVGGGCSGLQYKLHFDQEVDEKQDRQLEQLGVPIVIDRKSSLYLDSVTLDFFDGLERRGFVFNNPEAVKTCGCGSSFSA